ncbi:DUF2304 domain-containing protein [Devosia sp.]|uniref:DUF2304 domain-containing protein n=1 Tax=Devosia sp. TaxID=1871048 RepID=UPI00326785DB
MIIQFILILFFLLMSVYSVVQRKLAPALSLTVLCASVIGIVFTLAPQLTTNIAVAMGVGRGSDLILYMFILIFIVAILNVHLRIRANSEIVTALARSIAITSARTPVKRSSE